MFAQVKISLHIIWFLVLSTMLTSCYAPLESQTRKQKYQDSTLIVFERNMDGSIKSRKDYQFKSRRKTIINEEVFLPIDPIAMAASTDSTGPDTLTDMEIVDKQFKIDDNIYIQRQRKTSYHGGASVVKEKTKKKSKFRDGCEIVVCKKSKVYNEYGDLVFKENFNFLYWRSVRMIYDESGGKLEGRKVRFYFKPKFRNYP